MGTPGHTVMVSLVELRLDVNVAATSAYVRGGGSVHSLGTYSHTVTPMASYNATYKTYSHELT